MRSCQTSSETNHRSKYRFLALVLAVASLKVFAAGPAPPLETIVVTWRCPDGQVAISGIGCVSSAGAGNFLDGLLNGRTVTISNTGGGPANARDVDCNDAGSGSGAPLAKAGLVGNPVVVSTGTKVESEVDFTSSGEMPLILSRTYNSAGQGVGLFGKQWKSNFDFKLTFGVSDVNACYPRPGGGACSIGANTTIWAHKPDGRIIKFVKNASDGVFYEDKASPIARIVQGVDGMFTQHGEDNTIERYSSAGYVAEIKNEYGISWTFLYSGTYPIKVTHASGRYIDLVWTGGQLTSVRDPAGNYYGYAYHANRFGTGLHLLSAVSMPGTPGCAYPPAACDLTLHPRG